MYPCVCLYTSVYVMWCVYTSVCVVWRGVVRCVLGVHFVWCGVVSCIVGEGLALSLSGAPSPGNAFKLVLPELTPLWPHTG
jgi:hypothetical protein